MSGGYANLSTRGHSSWFLTRTNKEHAATMEHPFMRSIYAETFDVEAYCQYLAGLWHIYSTIEEQSLKAGGVVSQLDDVKLHRREALQQDLAFWWGSDWQQKASVSTATAAYLRQLQKDSADPYSLLCHHFLQYNAVLSGGQFLASKVAKRSKKAPPSGVQFYTFALEDPSPHARVQRYLDDLDKLEISNELRDRMLQTMKTIYRLILGTFDEAHKLCPVEGVSYASIKAASAVDVPSVPSLAATPAASPKVPPPPVAPGDRKFTLQELLQYDGSDASKPLFMSLLGRVYDVSSGKESFGPGGPYAAFAGHDATYNLAVMTLKKQTVDTFEYVLEQDDKECLADWIAYFDNHYGKPLGTLDKQHCIALKDLPRATKIPFSQETEAPASKL